MYGVRRAHTVCCQQSVGTEVTAIADRICLQLQQTSREAVVRSKLCWLHFVSTDFTFSARNSHVRCAEGPHCMPSAVAASIV